MAPEEETECNVAHDGLGLRSGDRGVLAGALETLQADLVSSLESSRLGARDWWCGRWGTMFTRVRYGAPRLIFWDEQRRGARSCGDRCVWSRGDLSSRKVMW